MTNVENIKEAIISIEDGVIQITFGKINENHPDFHSNVVIEPSIQSGYIQIKGNKIRTERIYDNITEYHQNFNVFKERLEGFEELIKTSKKFSWFKNLAIKNFKDSFSWKKLWFDSFKMVYCSSLSGRKFLYKKKFWTPKEYKSNNWVLEEFN